MYFMEMTYIPNLDEDHFFVWLSDGDGNRTGISAGQPLLKSRWRWRYFRSKLEEQKVVFEEENGERIEVSGCFIPMGEMFRFLMDGIQTDGHRISVGETFSFWRRLAENLCALLRAGHYYPTLLTVEKEGKCYAFSQWMLSRQTLTSRLFNEWIRSVPMDALSVLDLASIGIRQWLDLLLDTWTDRIIRTVVAPSFPWRPPGRSIGLAEKWLNDLKQPSNVCFFTVEAPYYMDQLKKLKHRCQQWHKPIEGDTRTDPKQVLEELKYTTIGLNLQPGSLLLCMEPENESDPFNPGEQWSMTLKVDVADGEQHRLLDGVEAWTKHLSIKQWIQKKFKQLSRIHRVFRRFNYQMYENDFSFRCSTEELLQFYGDIRESDVLIQFPGWMNVKSRKDASPDIRLHPEAEESRGQFTMDSLVYFDWQVSVGDISLSVSEFKRLVEQQHRFLKHHDEWIELPLEKMKEAYQELVEAEGMAGRKGKMSDLLRMSVVEKERKRSYLKMDTRPETENHLEMLLNTRVRRNKKIPGGFRGMLRPYQKQGYTWLDQLREKGVGGCLADDMGLGKTIQAIAYLLSAKMAKKETPVLIVCPTSLIENWKHELERFAPGLHIYTHHGPRRFNRQRFSDRKSRIDVMITSYTLVSRDASWLIHEHWPAIIIDEAQAIKNPGTKQSRIIRSLRGGHRIALTGTPMENRLEELWSIMDFLNPGYLGPLQRFRKEFIRPIEKNNDQEKIKLLRKLVQPFLLRREKTDPSIIRDLPDKIERKELCHLSEEQASLYQSIVNELMMKMKSARGIERKGLILAALTRLKQLCDHPQLVLKNKPVLNHSGKLVHFFQLLESLLANERSTLVFTQYVKMGHMLKSFIREKFPDCPVFFMHGGLPSVQREQVIQRFREQGSPAIFILSLKTGGVGLNLTEASDVIHYDRWWNPAVENQATDRTHRIGQSKDVHVYKMISIGTLEERIDQMIEQKKALTKQIIGRGDGWVTEMKDDEVYDLIRLREQVLAK